jgi:hypothetical protein
MAALAYFVSPLVLIFLGISIPFAGIVIPLVVWILLGEVLLKGSSAGFVGRLKVGAVAFVIYLILNLIGVSGMIASIVAV